jgi:hypothetical protein
MSLTSLLREFGDKDKVNVDYHNHIQLRSLPKKKPKTWKDKVRNFFQGKSFYGLPELLDRIRKSNLDILCVTGFNNVYSYEAWTSPEQLQEARDMGYEVERGEYFTFFKKDGIVKALAKSHEIATTRGHVLLSLIKQDKKFSVRKSLEETLAEANDNELKGADHSFVKLRGQNGVLATSTNLAEDAEIIDYAEVNGNFDKPFSSNTKKVLAFASEYDKPVVYNSDEHSPRGITKRKRRNYNIFDSRNLRYTSERDFRDSMIEAVRNKEFAHNYHPNPLFRVLHHGLMIGVDYILNKIKRKQGIEIKTIRNEDRTYTPVMRTFGDYKPSEEQISRIKRMYNRLVERGTRMPSVRIVTYAS